MTKNIYEQHRAAFSHVSAYCFLHEETNQQINVAFKYPKDGAGRLYCYVHFLHSEMVRGFAGGYGYDKTSAAFIDAINKIIIYPANPDDRNYQLVINAELQRIKDAIGTHYIGQEWYQELEKLGYNKHNVI